MERGRERLTIAKVCLTSRSCLLYINCSKGYQAGGDRAWEGSPGSVWLSVKSCAINSATNSTKRTSPAKVPRAELRRTPCHTVVARCVHL